MTETMRVRRASLPVVAMFLAVGLAGCGDFGNKKATYTCPAVSTVPDLQTLAHDAPGPNGQNVQTAGRINAVTLDCSREDKGVASTVSIEFTALRNGPSVRHLDLPYFIAIADSGGNILGKQQFTLGVDFKNDEPTMKATDKVTAHLPLRNPQLANVYTVIVGFQLNKSELDFNRAHQQ
jgi:hypothetical protein